MLNVYRINSGPFDSNCFIIHPKESKEAALIDPGHNDPQILETVEKNFLNVKYILITHAHIDHIAGLKDLKNIFESETVLHKNERKMLEMVPAQARMFGLEDIPDLTGYIDTWISGKESFFIGKTEIKSVNMPGHTLGGTGFLSEGNLFAGDVLFDGAIGRTDLPGGDYNQLIGSIKNSIMTLEGNTVVYPGHGINTTVEKEKRTNPFLNESGF